MREREQRRKQQIQEELRRHYEQVCLEKTPETFKRDMADYLKQQIQERRLMRSEAVKGMQEWAKKALSPPSGG